MSSKKRLSEAEFDEILPFIKISFERVEAARAVMVDGASMTVVGESFGWTKQAVNNAVRVVWTAFGSFKQSQQAATRRRSHFQMCE
jgi:hypothetical protein